MSQVMDALRDHLKRELAIRVEYHNRQIDANRWAIGAHQREYDTALRAFDDLPNETVDRQREPTSHELLDDADVDHSSDGHSLPANGESEPIDDENQVKQCVADVVNQVAHSVNYFKEIGLRSDLQRSIKNYGFIDANVAQRQLLAPLISGENMLIEGKECCGKTSAVGIAILQRIDTKLKCCQALILTPYSDNAAYTKKMLRSLAVFMNVSCESIVDDFAGKRFDRNDRHFRNDRYDRSVNDMAGIKRAQVLVGVPKQVVRFINKKMIVVFNIKTVVFELCDQLFKSDKYFENLELIYKALNARIQVIFVGNSLTSHLSEFSIRIAANACVHYYVEDSHSTNIANNKHFFIYSEYDLKFQCLCTILDKYGNHILLFTNSAPLAEKLESELLKQNKYKIAKLHRAMPTDTRDKVIRDFRAGNVDIIVTYPDSIRGVDLDEFPLVINYRIGHRNDYLRRVGRNSTVINVLTNKDEYLFNEIKTIPNLEFENFLPHLK